MTLSFDTFIGNRDVVEELRIDLEACRRQGVPPDHMLIMGPSGGGKTRLAETVAAECGMTFVNIDSSLVGDVLNDVLFQLMGRMADSSYVFEPYVLFFDEAHGLTTKTQNILLKIMDEKRLDWEGVTYNCRSLLVILATTNVEDLIGPLKQRCERIELRRYTVEELTHILMICGVEIEDQGAIYVIKPSTDVAFYIAQRARFTPRIAKRYLKRVFRRARARSADVDEALALMTVDLAQDFFMMKKVDDNGLTPRDIDYLKALHLSRKPMGVASIATTMNIESDEVRKDIEPFLRFMQYVNFTKAGREITPAGRDVVREYEQRGLTLEQLQRTLG